MTANPSDATSPDASRDLDSDPEHDALSPDDDPAVDTGTHTDSGDPMDTRRSAAEIAEEREERSVDPAPVLDPHPGPAPDQRATIPAVPKPVVPAVAAVLVFLLLAFPFGWTIWAAIIGAIAAAAISYAFVFRL